MNKKELLKQFKNILREDKSLQDQVAPGVIHSLGPLGPLCGSWNGPANASRVEDLLSGSTQENIDELIKTIDTGQCDIKSISFGRREGYLMAAADQIPSVFYFIGRQIAGQTGSESLNFGRLKGDREKLKSKIAAAIIRDPAIDDESTKTALQNLEQWEGREKFVPMPIEKPMFQAAFMSKFKEAFGNDVGNLLTVKAETGGGQLRLGWPLGMTPAEKKSIDTAWREILGLDKDKPVKTEQKNEFIQSLIESTEGYKIAQVLDRRDPGALSGTFKTYIVIPESLNPQDTDAVAALSLPFVYSGRKGSAGIGNEVDFARDAQRVIDNNTGGEPFTVTIGDEDFTNVVDILWNKDYETKGAAVQRETPDAEGLTPLQQHFKSLGGGHDPKPDAFLKKAKGEYIGISIKQPDAESWLSGDRIMNDVKEAIAAASANSSTIKLSPDGPMVKDQGAWKKQDIFWELPPEIQHAAIFGRGTNIADVVLTADFTKGARPSWDAATRTLEYSHGDVLLPEDTVPEANEPVLLFRTGEKLSGGTKRRGGGVRIAIVPRKRAGRSYDATQSDPINWGTLEQGILDAMEESHDTLIGLYQSLLSEASFSGLLKEELTRADKKEIKDIARKEAIKEIERVVGRDFSRTIQEEIKKSLGQKATKQEVAEISKQVLKKLYREMSHSYNPLIDRIKL